MREISLNIPEHSISRFCVVGVNFHTANAKQRSTFAMSQAVVCRALAEGKEAGLKSMFIVSTCNRTEMYAFCHSEQEAVQIFTSHTQASAGEFEKLGFVFSGYAAVDHLFEVASGLNSQIVGDYEILGQIKSAINVSRDNDMIGPIMDRLLNFVFQASKCIKTNTALSNGTVSVSYATIEWIQKNIPYQSKNMLLVGAGKLGRNVVKNIKHYFPGCNISISNRTDAVAISLSGETDASFVPYGQLSDAVSGADIIIVCTNADTYTIDKQHFTNEKQYWVIDLSVPQNANPEINLLPNISMAGIDEVSKIMQHTVAKRRLEIPKAKEIIDSFRQEFVDWLYMARHSPLLLDTKEKLLLLGVAHTSEALQNCDKKVNKTVGELAINLRNKKEKGCQYIHAYNSFLQP